MRSNARCSSPVSQFSTRLRSEALGNIAARRAGGELWVKSPQVLEPYPTASLSAWSRSARMSSICSIPTLGEFHRGATPAASCSAGDICRCVVDAGWQASDFASPKFTRRLKSLSAIVEAHSGCQAAADLEGHERASSAAKILLHQRMIGIIRKSREIHRLYA